jgi:hypothetical protein
MGSAANAGGLAQDQMALRVGFKQVASFVFVHLFLHLKVNCVFGTWLNEFSQLLQRKSEALRAAWQPAETTVARSGRTTTASKDDGKGRRKDENRENVHGELPGDCRWDAEDVQHHLVWGGTLRGQVRRPTGAAGVGTRRGGLWQRTGIRRNSAA